MAEVKKTTPKDPALSKKSVVKKVHDANEYIVEEKYIICKVCGHSNKETQGVCEMCSNYLY